MRINFPPTRKGDERKMKITLIDDKPGYGGVSVCVIALANELVARQHEVTIIAALRSVYEKRVDYRVQIEECHFSNIQEVDRMIANLQKSKADIVNSHADGNVQIKLLQQKERNYTLCLTEHLAIYDNLDYIKSQGEYFSLAEEADKIITVSLAGRRAFQRAGVSERHLFTVYNGVKIRPFYKRNYEKIRFMYAGRLTETKGIFALLNAIKIVKETYPEILVDVYGTGRHEEQVKEFLKEQNLEQNCVLRGFCDNMEEAYRNHEVVISPSKTESCSFTILEAMNHSCVVMASDVDGTRELIYHRISGLLHPFGDAEILAKQMKEVLEQPEVLEMFAKNAAYEVYTRFSQKTCIEEYLNCLLDTDIDESPKM